MTITQKTALQDKDRRSLLVHLKQVQEKLGYVPDEHMAEVAQSLNVPLSEIYGVATFYSFLSSRPLGRNVIRVCRNLPCYLKNAETIVKSLEDELGISPGETTADARFSLEPTNCIGACDRAPAMLINSDVHTDLTPAKIAKILKEYQ